MEDHQQMSMQGKEMKAGVPRPPPNTAKLLCRTPPFQELPHHGRHHPLILKKNTKCLEIKKVLKLKQSVLSFGSFFLLERNHTVHLLSLNHENPPNTKKLACML